jgi:hypothetical protein
MRPNESNPFYMEQTGYQKTVDLATFNAALKNITRGARKASNIDLQYRKFVSVQDVPYQYSVESTSQSGELSQSARTKLQGLVILSLVYTCSQDSPKMR